MQVKILIHPFKAVQDKVEFPQMTLQLSGQLILKYKEDYQVNSWNYQNEHLIGKLLLHQCREIQVLIICALSALWHSAAIKIPQTPTSKLSRTQIYNIMCSNTTEYARKNFLIGRTDIFLFCLQIYFLNLIWLIKIW